MCPINFFAYENDKLCVKLCPAPDWWGNLNTRYCASFCEWNPPTFVTWYDATTQRCVEQCPNSPRRFASNTTQ